MNILSCDDLLTAARQQPQPPRLLLVFAGIELPADASAEQKAAFEAGQGGAPVPLMYVDKGLHELSDFQALQQEASAAGCRWHLLFASSLSGKGGVAPSPAEAEPWLVRMVEAIKQGRLDNMLVFAQDGMTLQLQAG